MPNAADNQPPLSRANPVNSAASASIARPNPRVQKRTIKQSKAVTTSDLQSATSDALTSFHPVIQAWFRRRFAAPTDAQAAGWPLIQAGRDVLIAAPTGSGKTLAAFLAGIDALIKQPATSN